MKQLQSGGNTALTETDVEITISWSPEKIDGFELDSSAFLLTANGTVRGDHDFIFYNQPQSDNESVVLATTGATTSFRIQTDQLPTEISKIALAITINGNANFSRANHLQVAIKGVANYSPDLSNMTEKALIIGEVYNRNGVWKFRAVGQGFNGGLGPLATRYGVDVEQEKQPQPPPKPPEPQISLSKITLQKKGDSHTLSLKKTTLNQEISINLNWDAKPQAKPGLFRSIFGGNGAIDLDLGVFWELQNGYKSCIDGMQFTRGQGGPRTRLTKQGCYVDQPWVWHCGDDRSGTTTTGETILVNPKGFGDLKRLVIYCFIYKGVAKWAQTNAVITVKVPGNPDIEVELGKHDDARNFCAIAGIDFQGANQLKVTKYVTFHNDHSYCDQTYGWGMRWGKGVKG